MDSSVSQKDQFWFLRVCLHVPIQLYHPKICLGGLRKIMKTPSCVASEPGTWVSSRSTQSWRTLLYQDATGLGGGASGNSGEMNLAWLSWFCGRCVLGCGAVWSGRCVLADRMVDAAGCFETSVHAPDYDVTYQNVIVFVVTGLKMWSLV